MLGETGAYLKMWKQDKIQQLKRFCFFISHH